MIWKCKSKKIEYGSRTLIMGIVNVTPDSFSDGGKWNNTDSAVAHAVELAEQGADIIDFGAQSTRPNYVEISPEEEWKRLEPVLKQVRNRISIPISVDTYFPFVAKNALNYGVDIINDVSGVINPKMAEIVKNTGCGWVIMHNGAGNTKDVKSFFENSLIECEKIGIDKAQLCFDMGIGFGKSYEESLSLLANVKQYKLLGYPLLLGTSRKRVIAQGSKAQELEKRVFGNISADAVAIIDGVDIIRIHDVENEKHGIYMADEIKKIRI